jgi:hypothetical protein
MRLLACCGLLVVGILSGCASREAPVATRTPSVPSTAATTNQAAGKTTVQQPVPAGAIQLFDGKTLNGWRISDFAGKGPVRVEDGKLILEMGTMTGVTYTNDVPTMNYEISVEAMRVDGSDFFCGLTFPVGKDPCSLIVGGWGGGVVGLSSLDGQDAANNETTQYINFEKGRWYKVRLRVMPNKIQAWIDEDKVIDVDTTDRQISIRLEVEESRPLGFSSWSTTAALRNIYLRKL